MLNHLDNFIAASFILFFITNTLEISSIRLKHADNFSKEGQNEDVGFTPADDSFTLFISLLFSKQACMV